MPDSSFLREFFIRMPIVQTENLKPKTLNIESIWKLLKEVMDPEVPVLSVVDLGIIRKIELNDDSVPVITITPTYSGCPAMDVIRINIRLKMAEGGFPNAEIKTILSPAWTTD